MTAAALYGQLLQNPGFQQACPSAQSALCHWDVSWGGDSCCLRKTAAGETFLSIQLAGSPSVGFVEQAVPIDQSGNIRLVTFSARVRTKNVTGKGAGLNLGIYDADGQMLAYKDMGGNYSVRWLKGDQDWQRLRIRLACPAGSSLIKAGAILYGTGQAQFDDAELLLEKIDPSAGNPIARSYIDEAIGIIRQHSLYRDEVPAASWRESALGIAGDAGNFEDCYPRHRLPVDVTPPPRRQPFAFPDPCRQ